MTVGIDCDQLAEVAIVRFLHCKLKSFYLLSRLCSLQVQHYINPHLKSGKLCPRFSLWSPSADEPIKGTHCFSYSFFDLHHFPVVIWVLTSVHLLPMYSCILALLSFRDLNILITVILNSVWYPNICHIWIWFRWLLCSDYVFSYL